MKRALVLSGGGAKGAFHFGAIQYIKEQFIADNHTADYFNIISGTSVGALTGALLAMNQYERLASLWKNIKKEDILSGSLGLVQVFYRAISGKPSILDNRSLGELIQNNISLNDIKRSGADLIFGALSISSGEYCRFSINDFDDEKDFIKAILASASIPAVWPPVDKVVTKDGKLYKDLVDGGLKNSHPIGDILHQSPEQVIIINCNSSRFDDSPHIPGNIVKTGQRALTEISTNELFLSDLRHFLQLNSIVKQLPDGLSVKKKNGQAFQYYDAIIIEPEKDLGEALDFSPAKISLRISEGYSAARKAFAEKNNIINQ